MKTLFINGKFLSQQVTGVQRYAREMLKALDSALTQEPTQRFRVVLLVPADAADVPPLTQIKLVYSRFKGTAAWEQFVLPLLTMGSALLNFTGSSPLAKFGHYCTIHDAVIFEFPQAYSKLYRTWYKFLYNVQAVSARRIFTVSHFSQRRLATFLPQSKDKLSVLYNGHEHINEIATDRSIIKKLGLGNAEYYLSIASNNPNKNFPRLFSVLSKFGDQMASRSAGQATITLVIVGGSNASVFNESKMDNSDKQTFKLVRAGYVTDGQLKALLSRASGLIFPSLYEGFGIPPLEAMVANCAVVASNASSIPEVCGDAADYFDPRDEASMQSAIGRFIADDARRKELAEKGRERISHFSWKSSGQILLKTLLLDF